MTDVSGGPDGLEAVPLGRWSLLLLGVASAAGLLLFGWPLLVPTAPSVGAQQAQSPFAVLVLLPVLLLLILAQLSEGGLDAKALAMLGVLSAVNAALRPLGAGAAGIELMFFLLVLAGRAFGPGFGFVLGCTSLFASALLTAGVGPWLPFQMMAAGWMGLGAGLLPRRVGGRWEIALLVLYGVAAAYLFGLLLNLSFWPYAVGVGFDGGVGLAFVPGDPLPANLHRFVVFTLLTSTVGWDTGRAITTALAIVLLGPAVLSVLRRAARRARFDQAAEPLGG